MKKVPWTTYHVDVWDEGHLMDMNKMREMIQEIDLDEDMVIWGPCKIDDAYFGLLFIMMVIGNKLGIEN